MVTVNEWLAAIRPTLVGDATLAALVTGGWLMDRQASAAAPYGVLRLDFQSQQQTSNGIFRTYTLTTTVYAAVGATAQTTIPARLAALLDYKPAAITPVPSGGGVVMLAPRSLDQRLANELRSGADVTPLISQWTMKVMESRA